MIGGVVKEEFHSIRNSGWCVSTAHRTVWCLKRNSRMANENIWQLKTRKIWHKWDKKARGFKIKFIHLRRGYGGQVN